MVNRGLPPDLKKDSESLKRGETTFRRKGDVLLQSWRDTHDVNMISTIHNASMVDVPVGNGGVKKKPISISEYNMFMKGADRADQYLACYSLLFNSFIIYRKLNPTTKLRYKEFLLRVAKPGLQMEAAETESDTDSVRLGPSTPTPFRPHVDPPGQLFGDFRKHTLQKIVKGGHGMKKYPCRQCCVCAAHKESNQVHPQDLGRATPQRAMFREISQPQALLGAFGVSEKF
jgi:hypothetical protein